LKKCLLYMLCFFCIIALPGCSQSQVKTRSTLAEPDYWPTEGWKYATPESQGMDSELLAEAIDYIIAGDMDIHSLLIIRNGYIVTEAYFAPYTRDSLHDVASITKSISSTLIGIAIDQGIIGGVDSTVGDYIPTVSPDLAGLTVEDLLTMRTGLNLYQANMQLFEMLSSPDWQAYIASLGVNSSSTGSVFDYNSFGPYLCSSMLNSALQTDSLTFADHYLFAPLGIKEYVFSCDPQNGALLGFGELRIHPHDLAKIGYLFLNGGRWDGEQIVSSQWVNEATAQKVMIWQDMRPGIIGYGYSWWIDGQGSYSGRGSDNQRLEVFPKYNLIVLTNSGCGKGLPCIYPFMNKLNSGFILRSIESDSAIKENEQAYHKLQKKCTQVEVYEPEEGFGDPVEEKLDDRFYDQVYLMQDNMLGIRTIKLVENDQNNIIVEVSLNTFQVPDSMIIGLSTDGQWQYSKGRYGLPLIARLDNMGSSKMIIDVNELGNINVWKITIHFEDSSVSMALIDKLGEGKDMVISGVQRER